MTLRADQRLVSIRNSRTPTDRRIRQSIVTGVYDVCFDYENNRLTGPTEPLLLTHAARTTLRPYRLVTE
jgi:hypothetical protein